MNKSAPLPITGRRRAPARLALLGLLAALTAPTALGDESPPFEPLWPLGAPGAVGNEEADQPGLWLYPLSDETPAGAVVVCPGGGYGALAVQHEGHEIARWLNAQKVAAFVLRYRIAPRYRHPAPLTDVQRAIRLVRAKAAAWHVDPQRVGVMGFSAGGHLASTAATHFDRGGDSDDPIDRQSCRPDFAVLCYPVISFVTDYAHLGSRRNLLGDEPDARLVQSLSNELQVTAETPPTFLFHTDADTGVVPENSILFYLALRRAGVPAELHVYEHGPHGVGLAAKDPVLSSWSERLRDWLRSRGVAP
jgi:acetyl esterase/lipase